ncbi:MAG TPA: DUF6144 family protein [Methanomassiliicoccales archaeon]|nr:DUF6144 family protein [Methanomassiliicoccales archaeon]
MPETNRRIIAELGSSVEHFAGDVVKDEVMEGVGNLGPRTAKCHYADWAKRAIDRLDDLVDERTRTAIMRECGKNCYGEYREVIVQAKERLGRSKSLDSFLVREQKRSKGGMRIRRKGSTIFVTYQPGKLAEGTKCYCHLMTSLPAEEQVSITYCRCAEGFLKNYWEELLEVPVSVRTLESVISGGKSCRFAIEVPSECAATVFTSKAHCAPIS